MPGPNGGHGRIQTLRSQHAAVRRARSRSWPGREAQERRPCGAQERVSRAGGDLLRIGRRLEQLPKTRAAMAETRLSWTHAREIVKVADAETEAKWLELAGKCSSRKLRRAVIQHGPGPAPDLKDVEPDRVVTITIELRAEDAQTYRKAVALMRAEAGLGGEELDEAAVLTLMAQRVIADEAPKQQVPMERFQTVFQRCTHCDEVTLRGAEDGPVPLSTTTQALAECETQWVDLQTPGEVGRASRSIAPRVKRQVLHRDDYGCAVPGCRHRVFVDLHHVVHREDGGTNTPDNLVTLCPAHHRMVHLRHLQIRSAGNGEGFEFALAAAHSHKAVR